MTSESKEKSFIIVHSFVYGGDADLIRETVLCIRKALPEAAIVLIDDAGNPCARKVRNQALSLGCEWRTSDWPRGGNLRGKECITGILNEMLKSARTENDVLVKIDADTCLLDGGDIRAFAADKGKVLCAAGQAEVRVYGFCYCLRTHAARKINEVLRSEPVSRIAAEDVVIGFAACRLFPDPDSRMLFRTDEKDSTWTAYDWRHYPGISHYSRLSVVTVGNPVPLGMERVRKASLMNRLRRGRSVSK